MCIHVDVVDGGKEMSTALENTCAESSKGEMPCDGKDGKTKSEGVVDVVVVDPDWDDRYY